MKFCIPVETDQGIDSIVYSHFGSAPVFALCDTESTEVTMINNENQHHAHGMCHPLSMLEGQSVDAVVVGGIGARAITKLNEGGIKVYKASKRTVQETVSCFKDDSLVELTPENACAGHGHVSCSP